MTRHPTALVLRELVSRSSGAPRDEDSLIEHLGHCEECYQRYDQLWTEASGDLPGLGAAFLDARRARRLEGRLERRMHVASLGTASGWLVTEGFVIVLVGILLPIVGFEPAPSFHIRGDES